MPSSPARKQQQQAPVARCYSIVEVDPAIQDPKLLETIREKNKDALAYVLDPSRGPLKSSNSDTAKIVWYFTSGSHHVTGNLDLLTDVTPVYDRWVQSILGIGPPMQVLARGSVNSNGIILHDVWFVPDSKVNLLSSRQLGLSWRNEGSDEISLIGPDDKSVVGKALLGADGLYEVESINLSSGAVWYIALSVSQHMTGDLHLLSDFVPIRPRPMVQTHSGARLPVCGKGSVKTGQFCIPNVSYVPGLGENIVSISQLTDTGFTVVFGADRFNIKKRADGQNVGSGSYGGNQLFHLDSLKIPITK